MGALVNPLVNAIGGKFLSKALGHGARVKRAAGEKEIAKRDNVSYECVRRIDAGIAAGYQNLGPTGGSTPVGDEIGCYREALNLGATFTGKEFDDTAGKPLSVTHPEFYAQSYGAVPANTGSPASRGMAAGIQQAVSDANSAASPGQQVYLQTDQPMPPVYLGNSGGIAQQAPSPMSSGNSMWLIIVAALVLLVGLFATRK